MNVLVTGGAGYIGSVLVPELLKRSNRVIVLDNFIYRQTPLLDWCWDKNLTVVRGDVRDEKVVLDLIKQVDVILPLACITGMPACNKDPYTAKTVNLDAIEFILKLRSKQQMVIFPTTNSGYGVGTDGIYCTEKTPLNPISVYGKLKVAAETAVLNAGNTITLRLATVFGLSPRMRVDLLVNDFVYRAVTDRYLVLFQANFKRNYIHIRDIVSAFIHCINNFSQMKDEPYNVGLSEANLSKLELCQEIKKQVPDFYFTEATVGEDPDKRNYIVNNDKIEKTGFKAQVTLAQGISELIKGYRIIRRNVFSNV